MDCPICIRQQLLDKLKQSPQNQEIHLELMKLLLCTEDIITPRVNYSAQNKDLCQIHRRWVHFQNFLGTLNTGETITLLFGKNTKHPN